MKNVNLNKLLEVVKERFYKSNIFYRNRLLCLKNIPIEGCHQKQTFSTNNENLFDKLINCSSFLGRLRSEDVSSHYSESQVDVIRSFGYDAEEYSVVTEDGYILTLTRIKSNATKLPVFMMHGVISASDEWVLKGPGQALALILADEGHDVWMGDQRGNVFSRRHVHLNTSHPEYWDFSFHESGLYDLPAFIDLVLAKTGQEQLYYVGHSMGTTVYYVMCSLKPHYNQMIRTAVHLAPIAFGLQKSLTPLLHLLLKNTGAIAEALARQGIYEFLPRVRQSQQMIDEVCRSRFFCIYLASQLYGDSFITDNKKLKTYLKALTSGSSVNTMLHLSQIYKSKNFAQFDFGKKRNYEMYGTKAPPRYHLEKVTSPVALFYGDKDSFVDDTSIDKLTNLLPNIVSSISIPNYNHIDILFADNTPNLVFKKVIKLFI